jgi:hypothetical protein
MRYITFANQSCFEKYARKSHREEFLSAMDVVVPWRELEALIEPFFPRPATVVSRLGCRSRWGVLFAIVV